MQQEHVHFHKSYFSKSSSGEINGYAKPKQKPKANNIVH